MKTNKQTMEEVAAYYRNLREEMLRSQQETEEQKALRFEKEKIYNEKVKETVDFELRFLLNNKEDF